ncbi:unnamed protein product [Moneuplotes crassus]|uniref:Uncharacterized protein n=1 Tax=Euplotes crassus TaxID=5936 RepID=A0AAD1UC47_EUPCR|nr:unnamed protein product [Moneuplotes crassus]
MDIKTGNTLSIWLWIMNFVFLSFSSTSSSCESAKPLKVLTNAAKAIPLILNSVLVSSSGTIRDISFETISSCCSRGTSGLRALMNKASHLIPASWTCGCSSITPDAASCRTSCLFSLNACLHASDIIDNNEYPACLIFQSGSLIEDLIASVQLSKIRDCPIEVENSSSLLLAIPYFNVSSLYCLISSEDKCNHCSSSARGTLHRSEKQVVKNVLMNLLLLLTSTCNNDA